MATFSSKRGASSGRASGGVVVEGVDAVVRDFTRAADTIRPRSADVVVEFAAEAAEIQRDLVPVDQGDVKDSITSDSNASFYGRQVFADAGPDPRKNPEAFVARFLEHGTVKMPPRPFVDPSATQILPKFAAAIRDLADP